MNFLGVAGIAPYRLAPDVIKSLLRETNVNSNDAYQIFPGNDYVGLSDFSTLSLDTLDALGVVPYNIHGMRMSERILHQLSQYDLASALQQAKFGTNLWLNDSLTRTPAFQQSVISRLTQWAIERCASN
jgi:hypothetical protein